MSTKEIESYIISGGPSSMDLMLALFNRKRPDPIKFLGTQDSNQTLRLNIWVDGLSHKGENGWVVTGRLTQDSHIAPNRRVVFYYNDHKRMGSLVEESKPSLPGVPPTIDELLSGTGNRVLNCLLRGGINTPEDLLRSTDEKLLSFRHFGPAALEIVDKALAWYGLCRQRM